MIKKCISDALPHGFRFWETKWYRTAMRDYDNYRFVVLVTAHVIAMMILLAMCAIHLVSGGTDLVVNYCVPTLLLAGSFLYLVISRNINVTVPLVLAGAIIGMAVACFLPGSNDVFIVVFFAFPLLAFHLHGISRGMIWITVMTFVAVMIILMNRKHIVSSSISAFSTPQLVMGLVSYAVVVTFTYAGERQHCRYIRNIAREIVYDSITSLPEKDAILYSMDTKTSYLVAIISIDNLSQFVSLFGYEFSDNILKFVVTNIREIENDFGFETFRLRGLELGILLPLRDVPPSRAELESYLLRIWEKLSERHIPWDGTKIRLMYRISGAIATEKNKYHVLSNAHRALKEGIQVNLPVNLYSEDFNYEHESALSSVIRFTVLSENYEKKWFKAVYQPIIETRTRKVVWYESLLRIRNTSGDYEPPAKYMQIAKSTGMDTAIARFMLETACTALERCDMDISINITLQDMLNKRFLDLVLDSFSKVKRKRGTLIFEILERDEITDAKSCLKFINSVRKLGCKIAIDDFGNGHSNFLNVLNLPVDIVKIDGFLIRKMMEDSRARSMIEGIASLFAKMNIPIVAEFVENEELFNVLKQLNVDYVQGYHFGIPEVHFI